MEREEWRAKFAGQLRQIRKARQMTLEELETCSGISTSSLSAYERGVGNPSLEAMARLSDALCVSISQLLGEQPEACRLSALDVMWMRCTAEMVRLASRPEGRKNLSQCLELYIRCLEAARRSLCQPEEGDG